MKIFHYFFFSLLCLTLSLFVSSSAFANEPSDLPVQDTGSQVSSDYVLHLKGQINEIGQSSTKAEAIAEARKKRADVVEELLEDIDPDHKVSISLDPIVVIGSNEAGWTAQASGTIEVYKKKPSLAPSSGSSEDDDAVSLYSTAEEGVSCREELQDLQQENVYLYDALQQLAK